MKKKLRRTLATALSVLMVAGVVLPVEAHAQHAEDIPADALSYGYGGQLDLRLLEGLLTGSGLSVAELNGTDQSWINGLSDNPQDPAHQALDLEALELIYLNLGTLPLPLVGPDGLLEFVLSEAEVGVIGEYANARTPNEAYGAVGLVSSDGSTVDLTQGGKGDTHARINLLSLLNLQQSSLFTSELISEASLELGVLGAKAERHDIGEDSDAECKLEEGMKLVDYDQLDHPNLGDGYFLLSPELEDPAGEFFQEDNKKFCSGYRIADAKIVLDAPLIEDLMGGIKTEVDGLQGLLEAALGAEGALSGLLGTITELLNGVLGLTSFLGLTSGDIELDINVEVPVSSIYDSLLGQELSDESGWVSIDLSEGTIEIDLQQVHGGDLSGLAPNTPLISSPQLNQIIGTITSLLTDSAEENSNGLMAHLENAITGTTDPVTGLKSGGLYGTAVEIDVSFPTILLIIQAGSLHLDATLGGLLSGDGIDYQATGVIGALLPSILEGLVEDVAEAAGSLLEQLLFNGSNSIVSLLLGRVEDDLLSNIVDSLALVLDGILQPLANAIINRQTVEKIDQGNLFTVSALEVNVLTLGGNPITQQSENRVIGLPIATAAVLAQPRKLIDLNFDVAKTGNGRGLYTGGYTYDLVCEADDWPIPGEADLEALELVYEDGNVGDGFSFTGTPAQLELIGATGGLSEPLRVAPGSLCTVAATPNQSGLGTWNALRPTGDDPNLRTPYTYFLDTDANNDVVVSGARVGDNPTELSSFGVNVDLDNDSRVVVDTDEVGNEWKNHSFTFRIPEDAKESHRVSIVHVYDIDTRDIVVSKKVAGEEFSDKEFAFDYSFDGGQNWTSAPGNPIGHDEDFTLVDVPVLDLEALNADPSVQAPAEVMIREALGAEEAGPVVSWIWDGDGLTPLSSDDDGYDANFATASFTAGPVAAPSTVPTPNQNLGVTNSYAAITVDKHIDGELGTLDNTTLIPGDATKMTISYTVKNIGAVPLDTIRIFDESLWMNPPFTLPADITRDPNTGAVTGTGCTLAFDVNGEATCSFEVTLNAAPEEFFHYRAADAEVEAMATVTIDGRTITATATDNHGAMRLPGILGQLPATGVTTLVGVLALGLIAALGALALYVRSRRK